MYVCVCKAVRKQQFEDLLNLNQGDLQATQEVCGAGTDCGSCTRRLEKIVQSHNDLAGTIDNTAVDSAD